MKSDSLTQVFLEEVRPIVASAWGGASPTAPEDSAFAALVEKYGLTNDLGYGGQLYRYGTRVAIISHPRATNIIIGNTDHDTDPTDDATVVTFCTTVIVTGDLTQHYARALGLRRAYLYKPWWGTQQVYLPCYFSKKHVHPWVVHTPGEPLMKRTQPTIAGDSLIWCGAFRFVKAASSAANADATAALIASGYGPPPDGTLYAGDYLCFRVNELHALINVDFTF